MYPALECRADLLKMLNEITTDRQAILGHCARLTPDQLHNPVIPGTWSLLENLAHLARVEAYILESVQCRPGRLPRERAPASVAPAWPGGSIALDEAHAAAIAFLK